MILAIDPGNERSAFVLYDAGEVVTFGKVGNEDMLERVSRKVGRPDDHLVVEMIACYGMPVGAEVFQTCVWIGRFIQAWGGSWSTLLRGTVKLHLCGQTRAKDGNVRQALIDRYGGKDKAVGKKATQGPLYGVSADVWAALGVAVTYADSTGVAPKATVVPVAAREHVARVETADTDSVSPRAANAALTTGVSEGES